jgi:hypothetical protein
MWSRHVYLAEVWHEAIGGIVRHAPLVVLLGKNHPHTSWSKTGVAPFPILRGSTLLDVPFQIGLGNVRTLSLHPLLPMLANPPSGAGVEDLAAH